MGSLLSCLTKAGKNLSAEHRSAITSRASALQADGVKPKAAALQAVDEVLAKVRSTLPQAQPAQGGGPRSTHPSTVMGSTMLADISRALGGLDPAWIADFSVRVETGRKDKNGRPMVQWRNPLIPGVGKLFRRGGTQDLSEIAMLLEERDYIANGSVEADAKEAGEQALSLIRAALQRDEVLTLREQIERRAQQQEEQDQERPTDEYAHLDPDAAAEAEAERQAIMAEAEVSARSVEQLPDNVLLDVVGATSETAAMMRAMGFSEQEILDELANEEAAAADTGAPRPEGRRAEKPEGRAPPAEAGSVAPRPAEGLSLAAQTEDDLRSKAAREAAAAKSDAEEQKRLADKAKADAQRDEFSLTGSDRPADMAAAAGQKDIFDAPAPTKAPAVTPNKVFTEDAAAAARARLRAKLGRLSSGIDPETMMDGIILAGYHIEKGARTFSAFARAMVADLGDAVKPYLQSWYMAVRSDPRAAGFRADMDKASAVEDLDVDQVLAAPSLDAKADPKAAEPTASQELVEHVTKGGKGKTIRGVIRSDLTKDQAKAIDEFTFKKDGGWFIREKHLDVLEAKYPTGKPVEQPEVIAAAAPPPSLADGLYEAIKAGKMPRDNLALGKMAAEIEGKPVGPAGMKRVQEALEAAIVRTARDVVARKEGPRSTFDILVRLYESQPNLNVRTSTSVENQAYSTPAPLAYLASKLAGITQSTPTHEPTGGTGMLLIAANPSTALVNELNPERAAHLRAQGFEVTQQDAAVATLATPKSVPRVIMNPPFGSIKDDTGEPTKIKVDGYSLGQIDHLIAARALATMEDDGRAVLILGANKVPGGMSNNDLVFFNWLRAHYNVASQFEVSGDLYTRQGAGWPVRVVVIDGRGPSPDRNPNAMVQRPSDWEGVYEQFERSLAAERPPAVDGRTKPGQAGAGPVPQSVAGAVAGADRQRSQGGQVGNGNVPGERAGAVGDRGAEPATPVGERPGAQRPVEQPAPTTVERGAGRPGSNKPAGSARDPGLAAAENQFQARYVPRSSRQDQGVLIPVNMAGPTQDALNRLEDEVGDIDEFARKELGYETVEDLHEAFMGLQVDSVASAIQQIKLGKGVIIADQTGIGKGRQAAAIIRWAVRAGHTPVFVTVKPSLFTDMFGDLHDIGSDDIAPFIMNVEASIKGANDEVLFGNRAGTHRATIQKIADTGTLPDGRNALFMTYSQINVQNRQQNAVSMLAPNAVFILDESHNAGGDSSTGTFIQAVLSQARGVTYLSATYAKRPDNMPVYFKTDIGEAISSEDKLLDAMSAGGLPLQTVVSNNLVKAGQMFRRERSYDGVSIETRADTARRPEHAKLSDATTSALRAIVKADHTFHTTYVKELQKELKAQGERVLDVAGNQAQESVNHTEFSSVVHNFVRQMLLGLKAQTAADEAIASLKRGEKPLIAVENTMGSFLQEYAENNGIKDGDALGNFDYRTVLSRALERSRYIVRQLPNGDKVKEFVKLSELGPETREAYDKAQALIDGLRIDIPVSPIDWMRQQITQAGYTVAEITGRNLSVDYSDPKRPLLSVVSATEQKDKVATTRAFNSGALDSIILNVAGSTGISLHASEKFADQRQRHMIVAQPAQDINIFMQMLGRIHRTGQVALPKYTILNVDLPAEKRPTALLSKKMKSLNANTSSNTESATSVKTADMLNKYGDDVIGQYLVDNPELADELGVEITEGGAEEDIARKATGRLALMPVTTQEEFYADVEEQYAALIEYLNRTNQNELEPRTFDFDAKELEQTVLYEGQDPKTPFGEDAIYGRYSVKAQGKAMTVDEIGALAAEHLAGKTPQAHVDSILSVLRPAYANYARTLTEKLASNAGAVRGAGETFLVTHPIGSTWRVEINGDVYNAVVTNIRSTHKKNGNPFALSKIQISLAVNGALRNVTVSAPGFNKIEVSRLGGARLSDLFEKQPDDQREVAQIVTGNLLGAYSELTDARGTIITFTKEDGSTEQGILLPKRFNFSKDVRKDYRLRTGADAVKFLQDSESVDIGRFGIMSRDSVVRALPNGRGITLQVPKSKAKGARFFLDAAIRKELGDFISVGNFMRAETNDPATAARALDLVMKKTALYALPSMADEARKIVADDAGKVTFSRAPSRATVVENDGAPTYATDAIRISFPQVTERLDVMETEGEQVVNYAVMPAEGFDVYGMVELVVKDGKPVALADIEIKAEHRRKDIGAKVIEAILAAHPGIDLGVSNIVEGSRRFWEKMGIPAQNRAAGEAYDGTLNWQTFTEAQNARRSRGAGAQRGAAGQERQPGREGQGRSADRQAPQGLTAREAAAVMALPEETRNRLIGRPLGNERAREIAKSLAPFLDVHVAASVDELPPIPRRNLYTRAPDGNVRGAYMRGQDRIWLFTDNLYSEAEAKFVVLHEAFHRGLANTFGHDAKRLLRQMHRDNASLRKAADAQMKAHKIGLDEAIEEALADMAGEGRAGSLKGWDKLVALIRAWLQKVGDAIGLPIVWTDQLVEEFVAGTREAGLRSGVLVNTAVESEAAFSRAGHTIDAVRDLSLPMQYKVSDLIDSHGKLGWWHKTVGTMHNLAKRNPLFKPVYDTASKFLNDVSLYATEAANLAPTLLPKLEGLRDIARRPLSADDTKAIAAPIFQGTLNWTRDKNGRPVESNDVNTAGVVWTDAELKQRFNLNEKQIGLYREMRASVDRSLTDLAVSDMIRYGGSDVEAVREAALAAANPQAAAKVLADHLAELAATSGKDRAATLADTGAKILEKAERAQDLIARGYAPLSRFGHYTLDVLDANGERIYFGLFESQREANRFGRRMKEQHPDATINQGTVSQESYKLFAGVSPETLELFGGMLGLEDSGSGASAQAFQEYIKLAKSNRSAMKRLIQRKGIEGFSEDAGRVLAGFVYSNARQTSKNLNFGNLSKAVNKIAEAKGEGEVLDAAVQLHQYITNPTEEAQKIRGLLFTNFLGGSIAAGLVNLTGSVTTTFPYLSQYGGAVRAAARLGKALRDAASWEMGNKTGDAALDAALQRAEERGVVSPQEVHSLIAQAGGKGALRAGDGTTTGNVAALAGNTISKLMLVWGKPFALAEQFNRRATFIAAYRTAVQERIANPEQFAEQAVTETQFDYTKANRPKWARGAIGATVFTFKTFTISYLELLSRMAANGPEGKRAALIGVATLFLLSGLQGLPGADDLDDLIDGFLQRLGYNFSSKQAKREFFANLLGEDGGAFVMRGVSGLPGVPIDVAGRLGMGNVIPGTGLLTKKTDYGSDVAELFGPVAKLGQQWLKGAGSLAQGDVGQALHSVSPLATANLAKAYDMASMGMYRDDRGRKVVDTDTMDAVMKAIGFQPNDVAKVQGAASQVQRTIALVKMRETEIADAWARGIFEKDPQAASAARAELARWNADNPEAPIRITPAQVFKRVHEMSISREERLRKTAPKEIRASVARELEAAR